MMVCPIPKGDHNEWAKDFYGPASLLYNHVLNGTQSIVLSQRPVLILSSSSLSTTAGLLAEKPFIPFTLVLFRRQCHIVQRL